MLVDAVLNIICISNFNNVPVEQDDIWNTDMHAIEKPAQLKYLILFKQM